MRETVKIVSVLTLSCLICGFVLSLTYSLAQEKIAQNAVQALNEGIKQLAPQAARIEEVKGDGESLYKLYDSSDTLFAYAFTASSQGYQGKIKILAAISLDLQKLQGITILESTETPGLGARIQEEGFRNQFQGLLVVPAIEYTKGAVSKSNEIQAITGATISSRTVTAALNGRIKELEHCL